MAETVKHEVGDLNLDQITKWMHDCVINDPGRNHSYEIGGKTIMTQQPKPTDNQPGNNIVRFPNESSKGFNAPSWNDCKPQLSNQKQLEKTYRNMQNKPLGKNIKGNPTATQKAVLLMANEVARRDKGEAYLSGTQIKKGVNAAVKRDNPTEMVSMFKGSPKTREEAYKKIMDNKSTSSTKTNPAALASKSSSSARGTASGAKASSQVNRASTGSRSGKVTPSSTTSKSASSSRSSASAAKASSQGRYAGTGSRSGGRSGGGSRRK